ncbi:MULTISPECIES: hypothetical protein [Nostocales]|uniref:Uncharacterized protein n=3 Tax=Nostocales TaxID=1161 RepID=A0A0C1QZL6_9CYAN|nr:hypothetical protein [Tolypothrix bouteillei]KAF3885315.1 hypothetical protein DA73_0400007465 [Tolypothrix bouteillei VB521301]
MGKNKFPTLFFIATAILWNINATCTWAQEMNPRSNSLRERTLASFYNKQRYPTRKLTAVSRSESRGDWWFYKPDDISSEAMRSPLAQAVPGLSQGCLPVRSSRQGWRCPSPTIRFSIEAEYR